MCGEMVDPLGQCESGFVLMTTRVCFTGVLRMLNPDSDKGRSFVNR